MAILAPFTDDTTPLTGANLLSLDRGGRVTVSAIGGLKYDVSAFRWAKMSAWAVHDFAAATEQAVSPSTSTDIYVDTSNVLQAGTFPGTAHIPLATITTDAEGITAIVDKRLAAMIY